MTSVALRSAARSASDRRTSALVAHAGSSRSTGHRAASGRSARRYLRRRLGVAGALIACAVIGLGVSSTRFADAGQTRPGMDIPGTPSFVIVQPGDTLWSLARDLQPNGDIRPLVAQLSRAHGGSSLRAGERMVLSAR